MLNIAVIGLGLIGGSMAIDLRKNKRVKKLIGVDSNPAHLEMALKLGLVTETKPLEEAIKNAGLIILATPVDVSVKLLPELMDLIENQVIFDVGSTKGDLIKSVNLHPKRGRYVATHPMAGTEYSGPEAAFANLFRNKSVIFCDEKHSDEDAIRLTTEIYDHLGMNIIHMDPESHDLHAAYVSHISHISSFALALTVLEKEKYEKNILAMAGGGFDSTVRLAKSSAEMWTPILMQNAQNLATVIDSYVNYMEAFKKAVLNKETETLSHLILKSNEIRKVLDKFHQKVQLPDMA